MFSSYIFRTWWRLLKNHIKNFVKSYHEELSSKAWSMEQYHIFQNIFFDRSKKLLDLCLADSKIPYFWQVLESIHKFMIELHVLQYLFVRVSNKKQRRCRIMSNFRKGKTFHLLWQPSALVSNLTMWPPFLHPPKKASLSSFCTRREHTWTLNWKESLLICFEYCMGVPYSHRESRKGWWTLLQ